jgi:mono/diheme cytochrome c family protein
MTRLATKWGVMAGLLATSLLTSCRYDGTGTKMQWAPDMADSPANKSQRSYLDPPEGSRSMTAILYPKTPEEAEVQFSMPEAIASDQRGLEKGKTLYETYCQVCHGADAKGGHINPAIAPPDLTHPTVYVPRKDGFFFYRITFGANVMPGYGYATTPAERWYIIRHLRTLQKGA